MGKMAKMAAFLALGLMLVTGAGMAQEEDVPEKPADAAEELPQNPENREGQKKEPAAQTALTEDDALEAAQRVYPDYTFKVKKTTSRGGAEYYKLKGTPEEGSKITVYVNAADGSVLSEQEYKAIKKDDKAPEKNDGKHGKKGHGPEMPGPGMQCPGMNGGFCPGMMPPQGGMHGGSRPGENPPQNNADSDVCPGMMPPQDGMNDGYYCPGENPPQDNADSDACPGMMPPQDGVNGGSSPGENPPQNNADSDACPGIMPPQGGVNGGSRPGENLPQNNADSDACPGMMPPQGGMNEDNHPDDMSLQDGMGPDEDNTGAPDRMPPQDGADPENNGKEAEETADDESRTGVYTIIITDENGGETTLTVNAARVTVIPEDGMKD